LSIQPVHVAKSRRGQFGFVLAIAAMVAVLASFWTSASASFPTTTVTGVTGPSGTVQPGDLLTYSATLNTFNGTTSGTVTFTVTQPAGLTLTDVSAVGAGWTPATCDANIGGGLTGAECVSAAAIPAGSYTFTVSGVADGSVAPGQVVFSWTDNGGGGGTNAIAQSIGSGLTLGTSAVTPATATNALGVAETFVFTLGPNVTCASDSSREGGAQAPDATVQCTIADINTSMTVLAGPTVSDPDESDTTQVSVTVLSNTTTVQTVSLDLTTDWTTATVPAGTPFTSAVGTKTYVVAELRHMADNATAVVTAGETFGGQDVQNNVRGSRHVVCSVVADTGIAGNTTPVAIDIPLSLPNTQIIVTPGGGYNGLESVVQPQSPTFTDVQIFVGNGRPVGDIVNGVPGNGGLAGATCFSWVSTGAGDQEISVNYVSADGVTPVHVDWDSNASGNNEGAVRQNRALIKEWNVLEDSTVTLSGGATGSGTGDSTTTPVVTSAIALVLNPGTGLYQTPNGQVVTVSDVFNGSHVTRANSVVRASLAGVIWTVSWTGCGILYDAVLSGAIDNVTTSVVVDNGAPFLAGDVIKIDSEYMLVTHVAGTTLTVVRGVSSAGAAGGSTAAAHNGGVAVLIAQGTTVLNGNGTVGHTPAPKFNVGTTPFNNCTPGSVSPEITFTGREPGPLGSGAGLTVTEIVRFTFSTVVSQKKVFLAWAGNRVVVEADWRIPAGDIAGTRDGNAIIVRQDGVTPVGTCPPLTGIRYVKGSGPGNFVAGLEAFLDGADEATVYFGSRLLNSGAAEAAQAPQVASDANQTGDAPLFPQDACISRVIFESEDPGQVDIEAFAIIGDPISGPTAPVDVTKRAFVIYYMKFESVTVSLVDDVSKGVNHNSPILTDFTPGNPWDATKDVTTVDWNVSKDLLVRGRVKGWFVNENPSGRAASTDDPLNVLPANRWVMPDDWALLAGGPADNANNSTASGTAEEFRPYYDIMIDPQQTRFLMGDIDGLLWRVTAIADMPATAVSVGATLATATPLSSPPVNSLTTLAVANSNTSGGIRAGVVVVIGLGTVTTSNPNIQVSNTRVVTSVANLYNAAGDVVGFAINVPALGAIPAAGTPVFVVNPAPFEGPYSLIDICTPSPAYNDCLAGSNNLISSTSYVAGAAISNWGPPYSPFIFALRDTAQRDGDVDRWDAPMPTAMVSVKIRGTGFIKEVFKGEVYYTGTQNGAAYSLGGDQLYTNPFYRINIPDSPYIPAVVSGGGYLWDSWGLDGAAGAANLGPNGMGPYSFWDAVRIGTNSAGIGDPALNTDDAVELADIRAAYGDPSIARDLVVYSDNHGEFMVIANGDFRTDLTACAANTLGGGKQCKTGDAVGKGTITATADYPDFRGKHFPVKSNDAVVTWTWGGYKDVTIENDPAGNAQYKYVVFHAMDRDGFCRPTPNTGMVLLHSVLTATDAATKITNYPVRGAKDPDETIDFLIDSGEGIILATNPVPSAPSVGTGVINNGRQFAEGVNTFSIEQNDPAQTGILEFPKSSLAASGQVDECQAWIKVSNSLLGILNVLVIAHDDEGNIGFDKIIDLQGTATFTLNFRWSLITWTGADNIPVTDALKGTGANDAGNDISDQVTAIYGWDAAAQDWLGYFPTGVNVPGANDLVTLDQGAAYWIAIKGPSSVTWTIATKVDQ